MKLDTSGILDLDAFFEGILDLLGKGNKKKAFELFMRLGQHDYAFSMHMVGFCFAINEPMRQQTIAGSV